MKTVALCCVPAHTGINSDERANLLGNKYVRPPPILEPEPLCDIRMSIHKKQCTSREDQLTSPLWFETGKEQGPY